MKKTVGFFVVFFMLSFPSFAMKRSNNYEEYMALKTLARPLLDGIITLKVGETIYRIPVSFFFIAHSKFFFNAIKNNKDSSKKEVYLEIEEKDFDIFINALRCLHCEDITDIYFQKMLKVANFLQNNLSSPESKKILKLIKKGFENAKTNKELELFIGASISSFDNDPKKIDLIKSNYILGLADQDFYFLKNYLSGQALITNAENIIKAKFPDIRSIMSARKDFSSLNLRSVLAIFSNNDLALDSENSLLYLANSWANDTKNKDKITELIYPIRFAQMDRYFILDVLSSMSNLYPENKELFEEICNFAKTSIEVDPAYAKHLIPKNKICEQQFIPRKSIDKKNSFTAKCLFSNISNLNHQSRYYSAEICFRGYSFYYFLRRQKIENNGSDENENTGIGGYLRCCGPLLPVKFYLPLKTTVSIKQANNIPRIFSPTEIIFEAPEKAVGGRLTLAGENFSNLNTNPMLINDTMELFITVEFLDNDEKSVIIKEILD